MLTKHRVVERMTRELEASVLEDSDRLHREWLSSKRIGWSGRSQHLIKKDMDALEEIRMQL